MKYGWNFRLKVSFIVSAYATKIFFEIPSCGNKVIFVSESSKNCLESHQQNYRKHYSFFQNIFKQIGYEASQKLCYCNFGSICWYVLPYLYLQKTTVIIFLATLCLLVSLSVRTQKGHRAKTSKYWGHRLSIDTFDDSGFPKGQLISKCPFAVFKSPKKPTKFL